MSEMVIAVSLPMSLLN